MAGRWRIDTVSLPTIDELLDTNSQAGIRAEFARIKTAVNEALKKAFSTEGSWHSEPVNWADLRCVAVEYVIDDYDGRYLATIEEASPGCHALCSYVQQYLESVGLVDVEIVTEW